MCVFCVCVHEVCVGVCVYVREVCVRVCESMLVLCIRYTFKKHIVIQGVTERSHGQLGRIQTAMESN